MWKLPFAHLHNFSIVDIGFQSGKPPFCSGGVHDTPARWGHRKHDLGERLNGIQEVSGSIPLISTKVHREKACFKRNEPFFVCVFRRLAYPGQASTLPMGRSDFLNAPFWYYKMRKWKTSTDAGHAAIKSPSHMDVNVTAPACCQAGEFIYKGSSFSHIVRGKPSVDL